MMIRNDHFLPLASYLEKVAEKYADEPDNKDNRAAYMLLIGASGALRWLVDAPPDEENPALFEALNGAMQRIRPLDN